MAAVIDAHTGLRLSPAQIRRLSSGPTADHRHSDGQLRPGRGGLVLVEGPVELPAVYLWRRLIAGIVAIGIVVAFASGVSWVVGWAQAAPAETTIHTVVAGETLWSIAKAVRPGGDTRHTLGQIADLNSTSSADFDVWAPISIGQEIRVPDYMTH